MVEEHIHTQTVTEQSETDKEKAEEYTELSSEKSRNLPIVSRSRNGSVIGTILCEC